MAQTTRRTVLRGALAALPLATTTDPATANSAIGGSDAELMSIAERFDFLRQQAHEMHPDYEACQDGASEAFRVWREADGGPMPMTKGTPEYQAR